jgi:hypothetical protein
MKTDRNISSDKEDEDEPLAELVGEDIPDDFIGGVLDNDADG